MTKSLDEAMNSIVAKMDEPQEQDTSQQTSQDAIQDVYVLIVREQEGAADHAPVVDSTPTVPAQHAPATAAQDSFLSVYAFVCFSLVLIVATIAFQLYCLVNPPMATITLIPKSQQVTLSGTMQLGRVLAPLTISQSQTTHATGTGHQAAAQARGDLTFYNGQFQSVTIAAGTTLTGVSGIEVVTDEDAFIPAANPPSFGYTTVSAHTTSAGSNGNIPAYDINQACCATSVLAKNIQSFTGGQDARTYATVTRNDIHNISTVLKTTIAASITGALQGQLRPEEQLQLLPCSPTVTADHQVGEEATQVKVTVSQTCSAVAYNSQTLEEQATAFLTSHAKLTTAARYSLFGTPRVSVNQARISRIAPPLVFLSFKAQGTLVYDISPTTQENIKKLIAGKTTQKAQNLLASLPGVAHAAIRFSGFGDDTRLPKQRSYIHIMLYVV